MILVSIQVSFLAMSVIFLVLSILIGVIKVLVHFIPYEEPPAKPQASKASASAGGSSVDAEHLAVIHAVLAHHTGRAPNDLHLSRVDPQS